MLLGERERERERERQRDREREGDLERIKKSYLWSSCRGDFQLAVAKLICSDQGSNLMETISYLAWLKEISTNNKYISLLLPMRALT